MNRYEITYSAFDNELWSHQDNLKVIIKANTLDEAKNIFNKDAKNFSMTRYITKIVGLDTDEIYPVLNYKTYVCSECKNKVYYYTNPRICPICASSKSIMIPLEDENNK